MSKPTITDIEIIDAVIIHAATQKCRAEDEQGCRYRLNGLKCFGGVFIDDAAYNEGLEYTNILGLDEKVFTHAFTDDQLDLVQDLQEIHDYYGPTIWERKLREKREEYSMPQNIREAFEELENISGEELCCVDMT